MAFYMLRVTPAEVSAILVIKLEDLMLSCVMIGCKNSICACEDHVRLTVHGTGTLIARVTRDLSLKPDRSSA